MRTTRKALTFGLLSLATLVIAGGAAIDDRYVAIVKSYYTLEDHTFVKLEGACSFDEKQINCWNGDGQPDSALSERVSAFYLVGPNNYLDFKFNRKNRLAVFTHSNPNIGVNVSTITTGSLGVATPPNDNGLFWSAVDTPEDQKTIDLVLSPNGLPAGPAVQAPFHEKTKLEYAGTTLELGGTKPQPGNEASDFSAIQGFWAGHLDSGKRWLYYVSIQNPDQVSVNFDFSLLDHAGHRIRYVDRGGTEVSDLRRVEENPKNDIPFYFAPWDFQQDSKYSRAQIYETRSVGSVTVLASNVDPARVGFIEVSGTRRYSVLFKDIPLDPK